MRIARPLSLALCLLVITGCGTGKITNAAGPPDPAFAGTWVAEDVEFLVGHNDGALHVIAFNVRPEARWGALDATGAVTEIGRATVSGDLWRRLIEGRRMSLGPVDATLVRSGDTLEVVMQYTLSQTPQTELITLLKQPAP